MTTSTKESPDSKPQGRLVSYAAGIDVMDPEIPQEVKEAAIAELVRNPIEASKKNPAWYQRVVEELQRTPGYGTEFL